MLKLPSTWEVYINILALTLQSQVISVSLPYTFCYSYLMQYICVLKGKQSAYSKAESTIHSPWVSAKDKPVWWNIWSRLIPLNLVMSKFTIELIKYWIKMYECTTNVSVMAWFLPAWISWSLHVHRYSHPVQVIWPNVYFGFLYAQPLACISVTTLCFHCSSDPWLSILKLVHKMPDITACLIHGQLILY